VQPYITFCLLLAVKIVARLFYRFKVEWVSPPPPEPWDHLRIVAILNHTSLFEVLLAAGTPNRFLWRMANHGVIPAADKTMERPIVGRFYKLVGRHVVAITRQADHTWQAVMSQVHDPESMVTLAPEGRMKRLNGLDSKGQRMTVRGGIADLLRAVPDGTFLLAYSGGLHHVQAPGERLPRIFKTIRMNLEVLDIASYRGGLMASSGENGFKAAVIADLESRRERFCPPEEPHPSMAKKAKAA
jgi:hypothetical protein